MTDPNAEPPIVEPSSSAPDCTTEIVDQGIGAHPETAENAGLNDEEEQWLETVIEGLEARSPSVRKALGKALENGPQDVIPRLALELASAENKQGNLDHSEHDDPVETITPLLGTSYSQTTENSGKSSPRRSPERVFYDVLLRDDRASSGGKAWKTANSQVNLHIESRGTNVPN